MAGNDPAANLTSTRIRSAAKNLEQDSRRVLSQDIHNNALYFKMVAVEMEKENSSDAVAILRQGLVDVLGSAHRLQHQATALEAVGQSFEAGTEETDFSKYLNDYTQQFVAANPFYETNQTLLQQFDRSVWNIHHAGEAAPGQEEEEIFMITNEGVRNNNCPLTGKPVIELENPVRSIECQHIYDQAAVMAHIAQHVRRRQQCRCAISGCPKMLHKDNFRCDAALNMEIQELRMREQATQLAVYTELDLDDEIV